MRQLATKGHLDHQPGLRGHSVDEIFAKTGAILIRRGKNFVPMVLTKTGEVMTREQFFCKTNMYIKI